MKSLRHTIILLALTVCSVSVMTANAKKSDMMTSHELKLAPIFGSHMVLQCEKPIRIWGTASGEQSITVTLDQDVRQTNSDAAGNWSVTFPARKASFKPITLKVNKVKYDNILIGELWICAGQSNMVFPLKSARVCKELRQQTTNNHLRLSVHKFIRIIAKKGYSRAELARCNVDTFFQAQWTSSRSESANETSAVGWIFGNSLQRRMKVPVGIIQVAVGGSAINNWLPSEAAQRHPLTASIYEKDWLSNKDVFINHRNRAKDAFQQVLEKNKPYIIGKTPYRWLCEPDFLFEAGIAPLKGLSFRGVLWYQGESDAWAESAINTASELFPYMIKSWREYFGIGDFPFIFAQLPGFNNEFWPQFREAQRMTAKSIPNTAMAVTLDLGNEKNIHPKDKQPIGERFLRLALRNVYGKKNVEGFPNVIQIHRKARDIHVTLSGCGKGLLPVKSFVPGFEVSDDAGTFHPAKATLSAPNIVIVRSPIEEPIQLRYGWQAFPKPPLAIFNDKKLPLGPFLMQIGTGSNKPDAGDGK